jgi:uncharacterized membrane protein
MSLSGIILLIITILILDGIWIGYNLQSYSKMYAKVQGSPIKVNLIATIIAYIFIVMSFVYIVIPRLQQEKSISIINCFKQSGIVGLIVYGIYNFTNLALLKDYSWKVGTIDTIWGCVLFTLVAYIYKYFS